MADSQAARNALIVLIKAQRHGMTPAQRMKRKKPARWLYPWATEHHYATLYRAWVKPVREYVRDYIARHEEAVLRGDGADAVIRRDAAAGESFALMVRSLNGWVNAYISDDGEKKLRSPIYMGLGNIADSAFSFNGGQYDKSCKSSLGVEFPSDESWWTGARKLWQDTNYDIIRSDIKKYIADINSATEQAVTNGWSVKALSDKIQALDAKITRSRANFIARDQMGKLNGTITQRRMQDIGLTMYEWSSSLDERVRESHAVMDGKLCRWDDATVYSEDGGKTWKPRPSGAVLMHPGMDYQCRCTALAWFDELLDEADGVDIGAASKSPVVPAAGKNPDDARSIAEANEYARSLGIKSADYTGADVRVANEWNKALKESLEQMPELKSEMKFVGTVQNRDRSLKDSFIKSVQKKAYALLKTDKLPDTRRKDMKRYARNFAEARFRIFSNVSDKTMGVAINKTGAKEFGIEKWAGISVNERFAANYESFIKTLEDCVQNKIHPKGCSTIKSIADHEIGHILDDVLGLFTDNYIKGLFGKLTPNQITEGLSEYAWSNTTNPPIKEFIAEAWAEFRNNPKPRELAKKVGEYILRRYAEWKK